MRDDAPNHRYPFSARNEMFQSGSRDDSQLGHYHDIPVPKQPVSRYSKLAAPPCSIKQNETVLIL